MQDTVSKPATLKHGDKVRCVRGNIDRNAHKGAVGVVDGFATFSKYHEREVAVTSEDGKYLGWFWLSDVEALEVSQ